MRPWRYLLYPWWAAQVATGAKTFVDNPVIGSPRLNAMGLHAARMRIADRLAASRRRRLAHLVPAEDAAAFARDGFVMKRDFLPPAAFAALRDQVMGFEGDARQMWQGDTITRRIALDPRALAAMPAVKALIRSPAWRGLTRYVASFDVEPLVYIQSILNQVYDAEPDPQTALHADTFHATMKAWLFLTDVAEDEGPFVYVPGSHRMTPARLAWERARSERPHALDRLSQRGSMRIDARELPALGLPPPRSFAVPANTLVVADTSGFHARGPSARPSTRVEIWAFSRRNPFLPWTGLDPLAIPGIAERRATAVWKATDLVSRWVTQHWQPAGRRTPASPPD